MGMGLMYPGITRVTLKRKSDGQTRVITVSSLKEKLSERKFDTIKNAMFMFGEWEDSKYSMKIHTQSKTEALVETFG